MFFASLTKENAAANASKITFYSNKYDNAVPLLKLNLYIHYLCTLLFNLRQ